MLAGCASGGNGNPTEAAACSGFGSANKQTAGTAIGAVGTGLLTGLLTHNVAAGLAGAAVGGLVGNRLGAVLDADDCRTLVARSADALRLGADGAATSWHSARTDTTATIVPSNTRIVTRSIAIQRNADVTPADDLQVTGLNDHARRETAVRLAPDASSGVSASGPLQAGSAVRVVGKVPGGDWLMVARNGIAIGYVRQADLASTGGPRRPPARRHVHAPAAAVAQTAVADASSPGGAPFDLDAQAPVRPADLDAPAAAPAAGAPVLTQTVTAAVQCRDLTTTMTAKGQSETKASTACRSPDGAWELDDSGKHA